jgi:hypothetical protein
MGIRTVINVNQYQYDGLRDNPKDPMTIYKLNIQGVEKEYHLTGEQFFKLTSLLLSPIVFIDRLETSTWSKTIEQTIQNIVCKSKTHVITVITSVESEGRAFVQMANQTNLTGGMFLTTEGVGSLCDIFQKMGNGAIVSSWKSLPGMMFASYFPIPSVALLALLLNKYNNNIIAINQGH